jgi:hypothetical protein
MMGDSGSGSQEGVVMLGTEVFAMALLELDVNRWAEQQFGACQLGDKRRTRRAVHAAAQFAADPSGSTTRQTESWCDCKAVYHLMDQEEVTFRALAEPHWKRTRAQTSGHFLLLGDTTTVDFSSRRHVEGLGPVGDGRGRGFLLHSSLLVSAEGEEIVGLAGQTIYHRKPVPKGETFRQRLNRERESKIWGDVIQVVGPAPEGVTFTHVFDRGADNFEVYCHLVLSQTGWVVRAAQLRRRVSTLGEERLRLDRYLDSLPVSGTYQLSVGANKDQPARAAPMEVRFGPLLVPAPRDCGKFVRECGITAVAMWVVEVREINPPAGVKPLRWALFTSHAVESFEDAWRVIGYYEKRPLIEEFHKALKTGCRVESRQYRKSHRLEALTGMLSVLAVRLLQLKSIARVDPNRPAEKVVPKRWLHMVRCLQRGKHRKISIVQEFYHAVARLGGWLGRKHDGQPGWITLWRGLDKLILMIRGAEATMPKCG